MEAVVVRPGGLLCDALSVGVTRTIVQRVCDVMLQYDTDEGHHTAALIVIAGHDAGIRFKVLKWVIFQDWTRDPGVMLAESGIENKLRKLFSADGGSLVDGSSGRFMVALGAIDGIVF